MGTPEPKASEKELAGCSLDEAVQALRAFGSADAAADALLGGTPEPAPSVAPKAASLSETGKRPAESTGEVPEAKKPMSGAAMGTGRASGAGAFARRLSQVTASIDLD
ncbi:adck1 [Symbiodinium sp. KB8]|nr:adck1 [Symbiodinium sp. KB8]